jgi:hypothetical protein
VSSEYLSRATTLPLPLYRPWQPESINTSDELGLALGSVGSAALSIESVRITLNSCSYQTLPEGFEAA